MSDTNEVIKRGRRKVFSANQKLELLLPNGDSDGFLEEGDAVYVVKGVKIKGVRYLKFRVIKFADSKKENQVYASERKYFKPYFEKKSNIEGEETNSNTNNLKKNYLVPSITALSGAVLGYLYAKKYNKNLLAFGFGGIVVGSLVGVFLLKYKNKK
jgi:uncharacterized Zn ribbon protein